MNENITVYQGKRPGGMPPAFLDADAAKRVRNFHQSLEEYEKTPLVSLDSMAKRLGLGGIYVKNESKRFGLNAFKALGASYAIHELLLKEAEAEDGKGTGISGNGACGKETGGSRKKEEQAGKSGQPGDGQTVHPAFPGGKGKVFVTATDGNHGKGVAWSAWKVGGRAFVFMPKGSRECRVEAIAAIGETKVTVTDWNYDDTVRYAWNFARENGYYFIQDTGFDGYTEIPNLIGQGYLTMIEEALEQLAEYGVERPTHVFLQAGVGTMAGAVLGYLANRYQEKLPTVSIVEADESACVLASAKAGERVAIGGNPQTVMAGLNCGEVSICVWPILRDFASFYISCPDWVTELGMRTYAHPEGTDQPVISGESGAVGLGLIMSLCEKAEYEESRKAMGLDENSRILLISTEGNTDPEHYEAVTK